MLSGLHGPNAAWTESDYNVVRLMKAHTVKLMPYHTHADIARLCGMGVQKFLVRLPDSVWKKADGSEYVPSYFDYGEAVVERALYFYQAGIREGQLDNEPNISWKLRGLGPWEYRAFMLDVLDYIRPRLPGDYRLGMPSISFADEWKPYDWLGVLKQDVAERFDFYTVNSYWQSGRTGRENILSGPLTWPQFGGNCEWYIKWLPPKPIQVAEYGNSIHEQGNHTPAQIDAFRMEQYPIWLEWVAQRPQVEAAYLYIAPGATADWEGFKVTPPVAAAIGARG